MPSDKNRIDRFEEDLINLLPNLRRFALSLCRNPDIADDLVQITVERAFAARNHYDPATPLAAWTFRILRNAWIDMTRKTRNHGAQIPIDDMADGPSVDGRQVTEARLMLGSVEAAMAELPDQQREVMVLVCIEDMTYAEVAEILETPIGTVMSRLSRARINLAKMLGIE
ncbi:DNA-directed RNA polymerase sigma-70 factor [Gemmobacter tilapiae]|uniref:DNA-directed RNA polymerase sigma-70 factor n=1 Tax=Neogemmobacter tilapiae TaxID=875041 RepID=A0A918WMC2_9RHOB|nr:DNA-directed RNA polymerase sigma-70 factor [Gemmobacter tilapiae]